MSEDVQKSGSYEQKFNVGDHVLFERRYRYHKGTIVEVVLDVSSRWKPDSEFYVFYRVKPDNPLRRSRWMRGEEVKGALGYHWAFKGGR